MGGSGGGATRSRRRTSGSTQGDTPKTPRPPKKGTNGGPPGSTPPRDPCDLRLRVQLSGIDAAVLATVKVGDVLDVTLQQRGQYPVVVVVAPKGVLGSVAAVPKLAELIACIRQGNNYAAEIVSKGTGVCEVDVNRV